MQLAVAISRSQTAYPTASLPLFPPIAELNWLIPAAVALARSSIASDSPDAKLICSLFSASDVNIFACFWPSATLISACLRPVRHLSMLPISKIDSYLLNQEYMLAFVAQLKPGCAWHVQHSQADVCPLKCLISYPRTTPIFYLRISYLRHRIPQSSAAWLIASTIFRFNAALSASVLSISISDLGYPGSLSKIYLESSFQSPIS